MFVYAEKDKNAKLFSGCSWASGSENINILIVLNNAWKIVLYNIAFVSSKKPPPYTKK